MSFSKVHSAQTSLLKPHIIDIEVDLSKGLHSFSVVGLPDKAVEESRDRISAAIKNSGFKSPKSRNEKVIISLAPADIKKEGPAFDLGMAVGYLLATGEIECNPEKMIFLGELALDGKLRPITGTLPLIKKAKEVDFECAFVPRENVIEAALISGITIFGAETLEQVLGHIDPKRNGKALSPQPNTELAPSDEEFSVDIKDIRGQETAKRGLEIAAAGGHNVALYGPPGTGKTMLAKAFASLLPHLSFADTLEVTSIHSIAGILQGPLVTRPPFRSPHHTASYVAIVGGGANPRPGEATLAHKGVLFLDEFPEFERRVIDSLRQPLEDRIISVSRAKGTAQFPANFILVAAMNPCPCGNFGFRGKECICSPVELLRYQRKISGPILERIDIWLEVPRIDHEKLSNENYGETSETVRARIEHARTAQKKRFTQNSKIATNAEMSVRDLVTTVELHEEAKAILNSSAEHLQISPRVYHKIIKVARTIADLEGVPIVLPRHILEAVQYRPKKQ